MRRNRRTPALRRLVQENALSSADFIYPVFVLDGEGREEDVASMPGVSRKSIDRLLDELVEIALGLGDTLPDLLGSQAHAVLRCRVQMTNPPPNSPSTGSDQSATPHPVNGGSSNTCSP